MLATIRLLVEAHVPHVVRVVEEDFACRVFLAWIDDHEIPADLDLATYLLRLSAKLSDSLPGLRRVILCCGHILGESIGVLRVLEATLGPKLAL